MKEVSKIITVALVYDINQCELALLKCGEKIMFVKSASTCTSVPCFYRL